MTNDTALRRPAPVTTDPDTAGFWAAAARGALAVCNCRSCSAVLHLPLPRCGACGSSDREWRDVAPIGLAYAWTVVERQFHGAFPVPFTLVLIDLVDAPGARLIGRLDGRPALEVGTELRATFHADGEGVVVPIWRVSAQSRRQHGHEEELT